MFAWRTKGAYSITTPKSDVGMRDVAIPPHVIPLIAPHLTKHVDTERYSLIFPAEGGGQLQPSTMYRHWYRARDFAGRPDLRFHDLRPAYYIVAAAIVSLLTILTIRETAGCSLPQGVADEMFQSNADVRGAATAG